MKRVQINHLGTAAAIITLFMFVTGIASLPSILEFFSDDSDRSAQESQPEASAKNQALRSLAEVRGELITCISNWQSANRQLASAIGSHPYVDHAHLKERNVEIGAKCLGLLSSYMSQRKHAAALIGVEVSQGLGHIEDPPVVSARNWQEMVAYLEETGRWLDAMQAGIINDSLNPDL